MMLTVKERRHV